MDGYVKNREKIEWLNYWIEDANQERKRILLVGDSVTRQYRKCMNNILKNEGYVVDIIAMSFSMLDKSLVVELYKFIETLDYQYEYIVFHLGAHHGYWINCSDNMQQRAMYKDRLEQILNMLSKHCLRLITVSGTQEYVQSNIEKGHNDEIYTRNGVLKDIADAKGYSYVDLYRATEDHNLRYVDWCHFVRSADEFIANRIIEVIFGKTRKDIYNLQDSLKELNDILRNNYNIYIYGRGKRSEILSNYFNLISQTVVGYIVSPEYYCNQEDTYVIQEILNSKEQILIVVTPEDYDIYTKLSNNRKNYISLSERIYTYMEEYVNAYLI